MYSFVITAFNEQQYLGNTIEQIHTIFNKVNAADKYEIIVCDNNSTDNTAEVACENNCKVVFCIERLISKARNAGTRAAQVNG